MSLQTGGKRIDRPVFSLSRTIVIKRKKIMTTTAGAAAKTIKAKTSQQMRCKFDYRKVANQVWILLLAYSAFAAVMPSALPSSRANQRQILPSAESSDELAPPTRRNVFHAPAPTSILPTSSDHLDQLSATDEPSRHTSRANETGQTERTDEVSTRYTAGTIETNALNYLQRYGYMSPPSSSAQQETSNNLISEDSYSSAILDFQRFAGLEATGVIDNQTLELMQLPRCGNSDKWRPAVTAAIAGSNKVQVRKSGQLSRRFQLANSTGKEALKRRRRYALQGSKWRRQELTYRISQYPTRFNGKRHEVDEQIAKAFGIWSRVAPIDFIVKRDGRVHIDIRFASGDHGDGDAFDGPGNTLAHAYFPQYGGDAHFDDQEYWTVDSYAGTNIFQVAAHELGHSLGLGHSNVREALMAPFYQKYKPNFKLHIDDILAIQALYGEKAIASGDDHGSSLPSATSSSTTTTSTSTTSTTTTTTPPPIKKSTRFPIYKGRRPGFGGEASARPAEGHEVSDDDDHNPGNPDLTTNGINGFGDGGGSGEMAPPSELAPAANGPSYPADLCSDSVIDAITRTEDGSSYVFKGDHYWLLAHDGLAKGYPRMIHQDWEGLPGNLDGALTWADGKTFFFKGNKYWRFRNKRRDVGYPKLISAGFAGIPDDIDAAFVWSGNGRTYFFKGTEYWRFDSKADPPVSSEYPRSIKVWLGVPSYVNAAFKWENNVTYFFKGNQYYRFNDREFKVESRGRPPFPRSTAEWWFGCVSSNLAQRALPASMLLEEPRSITNSGSQQQGRANGSVGGDMGDWSLLAGLEENTRSMGTHISDHNRPPQPPTPPQISEGPSNLPALPGIQQQVITVDGPSGAQANGARQPRQHVSSKFEDFGWPMSRPRGGDMGKTLFSATTSSNGSGLKSAASALSASFPMSNIFLSILMTCLYKLITARSRTF